MSSDDSLLEPEFVFPLPGSDAEKKLKQAIQGASVHEGFDREVLRRRRIVLLLLAVLVSDDTTREPPHV